MSDDDLGDDAYESRKGGAAWILPVLTALVAAGTGLAIGALAVVLFWRASPTPVTEVQVPRDLTEEEIEGVCNPFVTDTLAVLTEAQQKVMTLDEQVTAKTAQVAEMEAEMERRKKAGIRMWKEFEDAKVELASLREQLVVAIEEKETALAELEKTVEELKDTELKLEVTTKKLVVAEEDVLVKRWTSFKQQSQLEICEKGGRRKMGRCREAVLGALSADIQTKYRHCVKSGQAVPGVREAGKDMENLPDYSYWMNEDERATKGWYITLCDPTLPEADDFTAALQKVQGEEGGEVQTLDDVLEGIE